MSKYPVADAHCDFLYFAGRGEYDISTKQQYQCMTTERMRNGNVALQIFAAWTDDKEHGRSPLQQFMDMAAAYHRMLKNNDDVFVPFSPSFAPDNGKIATILAIENSSCMMESLNNLEVFYQLGVRAMTLTWNYKNSLACPATIKRDTGLTELGRETVLRMAELGIAIDTAHLSDKGIDDVLKLTDQPIFSSHTNARDFFYSPRSMKNEHIKEIARRGGVIGVNFFHKQLTNKPLATVADIADQICYIMETAGSNCVALGSDFDGMNVYPSDIKHSGHMQRIAQELEQRGVPLPDIKSVMYDNLADYMKRFVD